MAKSRSSGRFSLKIIIGALLLIILAGGGLFLHSQKSKNTPNLVVSEDGTEIVLTPSKIKVLQSKVTLTREATDTEIKEGEEKELISGDKIKTDSNGLAFISYQSGTVVRIGQDSSVVYTDRDTLGKEFGKVYIRFKKLLGVQDSFEVDTPNAVAAVRGTALAWFSTATSDPKVVVTEHEIEMTPKDKDGVLKPEEVKKIAEGEQGVYSRAKASWGILPENVTATEREWLEFNAKSDEDSSVDFKTFSTLKLKTPTPTPSSSPISSGTPKPTAAPLSSVSAMPGAGYTKSSVATSVGTFTLACFGANKSTTRMLTDSGSDGDCKDNCPVMPLADYAVRNGGVAAMNGMYFCPADYPACAGKVNSFDTLFFNSRTRQYLNSENNVYSTIPFVGMNADRSLNFVGASSSWGRDTGIIGGTAGNPLLTAGGNYVVNEGALDDKQRNVKSNRGAIVQEGGMMYLCITQGATVPDSGRVYATLGADNAINVDGGGSSALWVGGSYKYGPGRNIPSAIIFAP